VIKIRRIDLKISQKLWEEFEEFRKEMGFTTRSEAIRIAIREMMKEKKES